MSTARSVRSPDVANVFWEPTEVLRCLECTAPILPTAAADGSATYSIWYTSNEDPGVYQRVVQRLQLTRFLFYKFCGRECCAAWVGRKGGNQDFAAAADAAVRRVRAEAGGGLVLGGLAMGMPLQDALAVVNAANGRNFTPRTVDGRLAFSSSSSLFYPCNLATLRAGEGDHAPLRELLLEATMLQRVLERDQGGRPLGRPVLDHLCGLLGIQVPPHATRADDHNPNSLWVTAQPAPGTRLHVLVRAARGTFRSLPPGSIHWLVM